MDYLAGNVQLVIAIFVIDMNKKGTITRMWVIGQKVCVTNPNKLENL